MIKGAIAGLKERKGSTKPRILKYIFDNYGIKNSSSANRCLNKALKTNVENGEVEEIKSIGSNLLFKLNIQAINKRSVAIAKTTSIKADQVVKSGNVSDSSSTKKHEASSVKKETTGKRAKTQNALKSKGEKTLYSTEWKSPRTRSRKTNTSQTKTKTSQAVRSKSTKQPVTDDEATFRKTTEVVKASNSAEELDIAGRSERYIYVVYGPRHVGCLAK